MKKVREKDIRDTINILWSQNVGLSLSNPGCYVGVNSIFFDVTICDTENKKKQNDEIIYFVGTGKDRLGVKVKLVEGTDGFPQISTSYAKELGKDKATKDDDFEGYTKIERGEGS